MAQSKEIDKNLLIYAGLAIGGYFALTSILKNLGFIKSAEQKAAEKLAEEAQQKFIDEVQTKPNKKQTAGGKPTKSEGNYATFANTLYEYLKYSNLKDNKKKAFELLYIYMQNDADIAKMIKYFGKRQEYNVFGIASGDLKDFSTFVTSNLSRTQIQSLNERYTKSLMRFRF
jgi:hypothetical protein